MKTYKELKIWQKSIEIVTETDNEFKRFLSFSTASRYELQTQLEISKRLEFLSLDKFDIINDLTIEVDKMIRSFIKSMKYNTL